MRIMRQMLYINSLAQGRKPDEGESLTALASSFAYVLDAIPTQHLEECFKRAIQHNTSDFLLAASAVLREYQAMLPELQRQAQSHALGQEYQLRAGHGSLGYMGIEEWKTRHNLPAGWNPLSGEPYPPESDLCGAPVPQPVEEYYRCEVCKDARWVKEYPDGKLAPKATPCRACGY